MSTQYIIGAWKDLEYRMNLTEAERAELPTPPAGLTKVADRQLSEVGGAAGTLISWIFGSCTRTRVQSKRTVAVTIDGFRAIRTTVTLAVVAGLLTAGSAGVELLRARVLPIPLPAMR